MAKLLELPNEILLLIFSYFDSFIYKGELQALCLTSKLLYSISQPILYTQFVREVHCQCCHKEGTPPGRIVPMVLFTRTIVARPDLASRVRAASFDTFETDFDDADVCGTEFDFDTFKTLASGFQQLSPSSRVQLFIKAAAMMSNPYLLVLTSRMPNLEHLELRLGPEGLTDLEPLFTRWARTTMVEQPYLRNLKSVVLRDMTHTQSLSMINVDFVMELPQLEDFTIIYLNGEAEGCPPFEFEPASLNISCLTLKEACLDAKALKRIMTACKNLKVFNYFGHNFDGKNMAETVQFDPSELVSILETQKDNLLTVRCNLDWEGLHPTRWNRCSKYGSFASLKILTHLEIDQYPYTPKQELPPSIHCLHIKNISFPIFDTVGSLRMRTVNMPEYGLYDELPNFAHLTLEPRDGIPNGMLKVHAQYDHLDDDSKVASRFELACERLLDIVEECRFMVHVDNEVWESFCGW
ncbi:hypothetical protein BDW60DRAFT_40231 [Aspergillus nidulans var. acristatus]